MKRQAPDLWIRSVDTSKGRSFAIWISFMDCFSMISHALSWAVGRGILANIGLDPVIGLEDYFILSRNLIAHLHQSNLVVLQHIWKKVNDGLFHWCSTEDL